MWLLRGPGMVRKTAKYQNRICSKGGILRKTSTYTVASLLIIQFDDKRATPMIKPRTVARTIPMTDTSNVFSKTDQKHPGVTIGFGVIDQMLRNAKPGTALKKVKTRSNAAMLQVGLGIVEQVPAQEDHQRDGDDLKQPRTHAGIAKAEPGLGCADFNMHEVPLTLDQTTSPGSWPAG